MYIIKLLNYRLDGVLLVHQKLFIITIAICHIHYKFIQILLFQI